MTPRFFTRYIFALVIAACIAPQSVNRLRAQPLPPSEGAYRLPYADGTSVTFLNDHTNHPTTLNRVDMAGQGSGPFTVVAAGAGWIRMIVEDRDTFCPNACGDDNDCNGDGVIDNNQAQQICNTYAGSSTFCCERDFEANGGTCPGTGTCRGGPNNLVWMEHPNGEWTKYTHMLFNTIGTGTDNNGNPGAQRFVDEFVDAGTPLGIEGDVGIAGGPHVHFEVAFPRYVELPPHPGPDNDRPPDTIADWFDGGGWLNCDECNCAGACGGLMCGCTATNINRQNRIPVFCQIGFAVDNDNNTSGPCNDVCDAAVTDVSGTTVTAGNLYNNQVPDEMGNPGGSFIIRAGAGASVRAGNRITLSPGFRAEPGSNFVASIGGCDTPGGTGE